MERRDTRSEGAVPGLRKVLMPKDVLDSRYELLELIGDGGMGRVYKAKHLVFDMIVAVKILHYRGANNIDIKNRFLSEARVTRSLNSEHILKVFDAAISSEGYYYLVTEYLEGETFKSWIERHEERDEGYLKKVVDYLIDICDGVALAHERNIVHRDLKPSNIYLYSERYGDVYPKILDFGLASENRSLNDDVIGTEGYMSPEQKSGIDIDCRTDIYALGVILYEAITGRLPEKDTGGGVFNIANKSGIRPPLDLNPLVPRRLNRICLTALEKDASDRYQNVDSLSEELSYVWPIKKQRQDRRKNERVFFWAGIITLFFLSNSFAVWMGVSYGAKQNSGLYEEKRDVVAAVPLLKRTQPTDVQSFQVIDEKNETSRLASPVKSEVRVDEKKAVSSFVSRKKDGNVSRKSTVLVEGRVKPSQAQLAEAGARIEDGYDAIRNLEFDRAEALFNDALAIVPSDPAATFGIGRVMFEKRQYRLAVIRMEVALRHKNNPKWRLYLGLAFLELGKKDLAIEEWKKVVRNFPQDKSALIAEQYLQKVGVSQ